MGKRRLIRRFVAPAAVSLLLPLCSAQLRQVPEPAVGAAAASQDDYIVTFRPGLSQAERAAAVVRAGANARFNFSIINAVAVRVPNANVLAAIQRDMRVASIVPDRPVHAFGKPTQPGGGSSVQVIPEGVKRVNTPVLGSSDGSGIAVAVLDTGIDLNHADLAIGSSRFDAFGGSCQDGNGHGTHVTGIIAALDNSIDVVGVAPNATPYCVKVLDDGGSGSDSAVIAGLDWVYNRTDLQIRVVNMSLGRDKVDGDMALDSPMRAAIRQLYAKGIIVVAAAGNEAAKEVIQKVPAGYPEVLAVGSTTAKDGSNSCRLLPSPIRKDTASFFTTDGSLDSTPDGSIGVTISAPGEDQENVSRGCLISSVGILSLKAGGGTIRYSGTSMAAPHVTGIVARVLQKGLAAGPEGVRSYLRVNASAKQTAPLDSPTSTYTFDGEREGVAVAP